MSEIKIDAPGAGDWIMERAHGFFTAGRDHSFSSHHGSQTLGGFVLAGFTGMAMTIHMAGEGAAWCSRELLWMVFHYAFEQVGVHKLIAPVRSDNHRAMSQNLRAGWRIEAVLRDVFDGAHMVLLSMLREDCPWLSHTPTHWRPSAEEVPDVVR